MTRSRQPRQAASHPDDVWRPGEEARAKRRLLHKIMGRWPPEMREEFRRHRAAELAARGPHGGGERR